MRGLLFPCLLLALCAKPQGLSWLSGSLVSWKDPIANRTACKELKGLSKRQQRFCRRNPQIIPSIAGGALAAYSECQYQFRKRRWNCTLLETAEGGGKGLQEGTREAAFVHALSAAGVAYKVTKDCSRGLSDLCGCDTTGKRKQMERQAGVETSRVFEYEGCSDNVHYGIGVSREFVDSAEKAKKRNELAILNLHNNRAGREVLQGNLRRECKCHGMSGSCEVKTCWNALPSFREVGETMREKFDGATEVFLVRAEDNNTRLTLKHNHLKRHTHADLVYMEKSPDYCESDLSKGILGTRGRECNESSAAMDGCQLMCCSRGHKRVVRKKEEKCNCKFIYCCRVECSVCVKEEISFVCL